jgi:hypothetical protein
VYGGLRSHRPRYLLGWRLGFVCRIGYCSFFRRGGEVRKSYPLTVNRTRSSSFYVVSMLKFRYWIYSLDVPRKKSQDTDGTTSLINARGVFVERCPLSACLTTWGRAYLEKLVKKFLASYGTRRLITVFTRACHCSFLSQMYPVILPYHIHLGLPSGLFPSSTRIYLFKYKELPHVSQVWCSRHDVLVDNVWWRAQLFLNYSPLIDLIDPRELNGSCCVYPAALLGSFRCYGHLTH